MMEVMRAPAVTPTGQVYGGRSGIPPDRNPIGQRSRSKTHSANPISSTSDLPPMVTDDDPFLRAGARVGRDSPDTEVGQISSATKPDLALYCAACQQFVGLKLLAEHRTYHTALDVLQFKDPPPSLHALMKRRRTLIRRLKADTSSTKPLDPCHLQKLNDAYEILKADIEDTFDTNRRIPEGMDTSVRGVALNCSADCASAVGICCHDNQRWKSDMEDTRVFQDYFGNDPHKCFFAIYDGHHGRFAAEIAANELHHALLLAMEKFDPRTKCTCTFNMADKYDISDYEFNEIHSRATSSKYSERQGIHEASTNIIHQIISTCSDKLADLQMPAEAEQEEAAPSHTNHSAHARSEKKTAKVKDLFAARMSQAFVKAHKYTDFILSYGKDEHSRVRWSGTSTAACVIQDFSKDANVTVDQTIETKGAGQVEAAEEEETRSKASDVESEDLGVIHLANAGNVRAVLVRGNKAYRLSKDHTPYNTKETKRVLHQGGTVNESKRELRVNSILATTRGLGNHGDPALKRCVITRPYTTSVKIDQFAQFLILASKGVWDVFSDDEASSLLLQMLPSNQVPAPSRLSSNLNFIFGGPPSQVTHSGVQSETTHPSTSHRSGGLPSADKTGILKSEHSSTRPKSSVHIIEGETSSTPVRRDDGHDQTETVQQESPERNGAVGHGYGFVLGREDGENASGISYRDNRSTSADLQTEAGSRHEHDFEDDDDEESGNEADIDTDLWTLDSRSGCLMHTPTPAELQRDLAKGLSERLVQSAILAGARDNVTAMVILFPGAGV